MCIFTQPVQSVSDTQIFARVVSEGWQYLVYQMKYSTSQVNAMILPLPVQIPADEKGSLEFISLQEHPHFFEELTRGFPLAPIEDAQASRGISTDLAESKLEVQEVGDFIASFVPSLADFDRLDEQFRIPQESWDKIPRYADYGFAVFQLKSLEGQPHPMAFRFRSRLAEEDRRAIFFPTVHIHDGEVHDREEFDHTLYLQSEEFDAACGDYQQGHRLVADSATGYVRSKWPARRFCNIEASSGILDGEALIHRLDKRGLHVNDDVLASLDLSQTEKQTWSPPQQGLTALAGVVTLLGLTWLFNRRDKLAGK